MNRLSLPAAVSGRQRQTRVKPEAVITVQKLLMMSDNNARNVLSNQGK